MKLGIINQYRGLRKELYILFIGNIMTCLGSMVWPVFTLMLSTKLGWDASTIAIALLIYSFVSIPINLIGGKLADKFNKRNIIVICDIISVACFITCFFLPIAIPCVCIFAVGSFFQEMEMPSYDALVADFTTTKDRERAYSLSYLGRNLGLILAPTIAGLLLKDYLNLTFLINGIAIACSTICIFFFIKDVSKTPDDSIESEYEKITIEKGNTLKLIFKNKVLLLYMGFVAIEYFVYNMYAYLFPLELIRAYGDNGSVIYGTMASVNCILVTVCTIFVTKLMSKVSELTKIIIGTASFIVAYILFAFAIQYMPMPYIGIIIFTYGEIVITISRTPYITKRIPASHRGRIISISMAVGTIFYGTMQLLVGYLYDHTNSYATWGFVCAFALLGIIILIFMKKLDYKYYRNLHYATKLNDGHLLSIKSINKALLKNYFQDYKKNNFIYSEKWMSEYFEKENNDKTKHSLLIMYDGTPIGLISIDNISLENKTGTFHFELKYEKDLNKNYEYEASKILIRYAFSRYGLDNLYFDVKNDDEINKNFAISLGLKEIKSNINDTRFAIDKEQYKAQLLS